MSEENVELVRRALEALDRRDLTTWLAVHDQDFEIVPIPHWPEPVVRGAEAAWDYYLETFNIFEGFSVADAEVTDAGADKVLVHYEYDLRGRGAAQGSTSSIGSSPPSGRGPSFGRSGSRSLPKPSKPPGCRSSRFGREVAACNGLRRRA